MTADKRYNLARWKKLRRQILERDNYECQLRRTGCTTVASAVDHIESPREGGAFFDPANLRAACTHCNSSRGAAYGNRKRQLANYRPSRDW